MKYYRSIKRYDGKLVHIFLLYRDNNGIWEEWVHYGGKDKMGGWCPADPRTKAGAVEISRLNLIIYGVPNEHITKG